MRIAIVNDMAMAVEALRRVIASAAPKLQIAWIARDGAEAVRLSAQDRPDLILMDIIMPGMDGVEATRQIMAQSPCAILLVTATVDGNAGKVFEALGAGALDAVRTPALGGSSSSLEASALLYKIDMLGKLIGDSSASSQRDAAGQNLTPKHDPAEKLVAIGASAGGPAALATVLRQLPINFPAAIVVIQHVDEQFAAGLADWLGGQSTLPVAIAREGDRLQTGKVLMAGTADHLTLNSQLQLGYTPHPVDTAYRPSVNVFFESVVKHWRGQAAGVLLTGMGRDGALGLKAMRDAGFHTVAQNQASSAVYGMPKAAAALNAAVEILTLEQIAPTLIKQFASP